MNKPIPNKQEDDIECLFEAMPEQDRRYCLSGRSVEELAHLAKNLIQMVSGSVEIMELGFEKKQYDRVQRSWDIFKPNFNRLKEFVLDLIKYTKQYPIQKVSCDLNKLVEKAIKSCECYLKKRQVNLRFTPDASIPSIPLDPDRIEEMAANLITHSLDNLPDPGGTVTIQIKYLTDHRQIQLSVCDDGTALSNEVLSMLIHPLERTRNMCGTGFDIPLAKIYVEQHDGYMEFESTPDKGNCIYVYLPVPDVTASKSD